MWRPGEKVNLGTMESENDKRSKRNFINGDVVELVEVAATTSRNFIDGDVVELVEVAATTSEGPHITFGGTVAGSRKVPFSPLIALLEQGRIVDEDFPFAGTLEELSETAEASNFALIESKRSFGHWAGRVFCAKGTESTCLETSGLLHLDAGNTDHSEKTPSESVKKEEREPLGEKCNVCFL